MISGVFCTQGCSSSDHCSDSLALFSPFEVLLHLYTSDGTINCFRALSQYIGYHRGATWLSLIVIRVYARVFEIPGGWLSVEGSIGETPLAPNSFSPHGGSSIQRLVSTQSTILCMKHQNFAILCHCLNCVPKGLTFPSLAQTDLLPLPFYYP